VFWAPVNRLANLLIAIAGSVVVGRWHLHVWQCAFRGWAVGSGRGVVVGMATDPTSQGYWIADSGGQFAAEDAPL
jgi:hypothetical protein